MDLKQKKYRIESGLFLAEGLNLFLELRKNLKWIEKIIVTEKFYNENPDLFIGIHSSVYFSSQKEIEKLSDTKTPQPIICVIRNLHSGITKIKSNHEKILYLYKIQDPGNCGTLIRTASWFGWDSVILSHDSVDWQNPKVVRSSMGAFQSIDITTDNDSNDFLKSLTKSHHVYRLNMNGTDLSLIQKVKSKLAIMVGNESNGFSEFPKDIERFTDVTIGGFHDHVESLNASVAGALAVYEFSK